MRFLIFLEAFLNCLKPPRRVSWCKSSTSGSSNSGREGQGQIGKYGSPSGWLPFCGAPRHRSSASNVAEEAFGPSPAPATPGVAPAATYPGLEDALGEVIDADATVLHTYLSGKGASEQTKASTQTRMFLSSKAFRKIRKSIWEIRKRI